MPNEAAADAAADKIVVLVTVPDFEEGARLARILVEEQLAACVNLVPQLRSFFRWQGQVQVETEALLVIKSRADMWEDLRARVVELHRYEVPEVIALPLVAGHAPYLAWIDESVGP